MDRVNLFEYCPGNSILHRADPRLKLGALFLLCITVFLCSGWGLLELTALIAGLLITTRVPWKLIFRGGKFFFFLGVVIVISMTFTAGPETQIHPALPAATWEGLISGAVLAARLLLFAAAGILILSTTTLQQISGALSGLFRIIPGIEEHKLSLMIGLTVTFVPAILTQAEEVSNAQRARCIASAKRPIRRISLFSGTLLRNIFRHTDEIADAMVARGYTGKRTPISMKARATDWILFSGIAALCTGAVLTDLLW